MGYDPLGWGGNIHGIRKRKLYHRTRESGRSNFIMGPFRVGGAFMESGRGNFIMGHERGWLWAPPNIGVGGRERWTVRNYATKGL